MRQINMIVGVTPTTQLKFGAFCLFNCWGIIYHFPFWREFNQFRRFSVEIRFFFGGWLLILLRKFVRKIVYIFQIGRWEIGKFFFFAKRIPLACTERKCCSIYCTLNIQLPKRMKMVRLVCTQHCCLLCKSIQILSIHESVSEKSLAFLKSYHSLFFSAITPAKMVHVFFMWHTSVDKICYCFHCAEDKTWESHSS